MSTKYISFFWCGVRHVLVCASFGLIVCALTVSTFADELDDELVFIDALQRNRMSDIAEAVIKEARKRFPVEKYPDINTKLKVREIQILIWQNKMAEVEKIIAAMPDKNSPEYWAIVLAMADGHYAFQNYNAADKLYNDFFDKVKKPIPSALASFYRDSAYKYAQMLLYLNRDADALKAYRLLKAIPLEEVVQRSIEAESAELILRLAPQEKDGAKKSELIKEADELCNKLLWKQDIWFGKAIVMKAHLLKMQNKIKGAQKLIETYMPQLKTIHDSLKEEDPDGSLGQLRMSPMPQCRFLMASMRLDAALEETKKSAPDEELIKEMLLGERDTKTNKRNTAEGAYSQFLNVFVRYPESQWAFDAGEKVETIRQLIKKRYNVLMKEDIKPSDLEKLVVKQFEDAQLTFRQNLFKEAIEKYLAVLNKLPETSRSPFALADLAISYIELASTGTNISQQANNILLAETVAGHLSERFCERPAIMRDAGDQLRRIADHFGEVKMEKQRRDTYSLFFRDFPSHYAASQLIMSDAEREFAEKNYPAAIKRYQDIATIYTNSVYYFSALSRLAQIEKEEGRHMNEIQALETYVQKMTEQNKPSSELISGKFRLADAQREYAGFVARNAFTNASPESVEANQAEVAKWLARAINGLTDISKRLKESPASYYVNLEEKKRNETLKEAADFTRAVCLTMIQQPADKLEALRKAAIKAFESYIKEYPQGKYASKAQLQIGTLYTILKDVPNAQAAFEKLSRDYPASDEAKNSIPRLADSLIKMGLVSEGIAKYREMFAAKGTYTDTQFMDAGKALESSKGGHDLALQAYDNVLAMTKDKGLIAMAKLGRASAMAGQKRYSESFTLLKEFTKEYAKLEIVVDANLLLVEVASELGKTEKDNDQRKSYFNAAVDALQMVKRYKEAQVKVGKPLKHPAELKELDLMAGEVLVRKMLAEKALGLADQAEKTRGHAIVAFTGIVVSIDPNNVALANVLEKAYYNALPLMLEHIKVEPKVADDVISDGENYLKQFPNGKYRTDVQNWLNQAKINK
jgi:TolA-binding protein